MPFAIPSILYADAACDTSVNAVVSPRACRDVMRHTPSPPHCPKKSQKERQGKGVEVSRHPVALQSNKSFAHLMMTDIEYHIQAEESVGR